MVCGIVDLGSNTIRLSIYETQDGAARLLLHKKVMAGLSAYVTEGALSDRGIARACAVLESYRGILANFHIEHISVFATASLRNITNTEQAVRRIQEVTGITVEVLSGAEEARLVFYGATHAVEFDEGLVLDIGGGSTEYTAFRGKEILWADSIPAGSLNQFYKHVSSLLPTSSAMKKIRTDVLAELKQKGFFQVGKQRFLCGVGGTIRATRKLYNEIYELPAENHELEVAKVDRLLRLYEEEQRAFFRPVLRIAPERIHTILPGMLILSTMARSCAAETITVSSYGVREGFLFDRVLRV